MQSFRYQDNRFSFEGCASVQIEEEWAMPWRVDYERLELYPFLKDEVARCASGVRLAMTTDATEIRLELEECPEGTKLDLFSDAELTEELSLEVNSKEACFRSLPAGTKQIEIWLPQGLPFKLRRVKVPAAAGLRKTVETRKRWITYGSSISHARAGKSPSRVWPALVAQKLGLHLTSFGFGGNCQSEPMMGRLIRDLPADYITLKLGINSVGGALSSRTFKPNVIGLVELIREKHPAIPLALVSPIYSPPREKVKGASGLSLEDMRVIHQEVVTAFRSYGDRNIYYVDGLRIFGEEELEYLPDELHPDADGQFVLAENFVREVFNQFPA